MSEYKYRTVNGKRVPEHRAVVEELLGINLRDDQVVHHINGDKTDNRPENLQILDWREHSRLHASTMPQTPEKQRKVSAARKGKSNPDARALTDEQVEVIVRALHEGATVTRLAKEMSPVCSKRRRDPRLTPALRAKASCVMPKRRRLSFSRLATSIFACPGRRSFVSTLVLICSQYP